MEEYIKELLNEIDTFVKKFTNFKPDAEKYSYSIYERKVIGRMIINDQVQEQVQEIKIRIYWNEFYKCYDITYTDEENKENFCGIGFTVVINEDTENENSVIVFVKNIEEFKTFILGMFNK